MKNYCVCEITQLPIINAHDEMTESFDHLKRAVIVYEDGTIIENVHLYIDYNTENYLFMDIDGNLMETINCFVISYTFYKILKKHLYFQQKKEKIYDLFKIYTKRVNYFYLDIEFQRKTEILLSQIISDYKPKYMNYCTTIKPFSFKIHEILKNNVSGKNFFINWINKDDLLYYVYPFLKKQIYHKKTRQLLIPNKSLEYLFDVVNDIMGDNNFCIVNPP